MTATTPAPGPLQRFLDQAQSFEADATRDLEAARTLEELEAARVRHLGDAQGRLRVLQRELGALAKDDRPSAGRRFNEVKRRIEELHAGRKAALEASARHVIACGEGATKRSVVAVNFGLRREEVVYRPRLMGHRAGPYAARAAVESWSRLTASGGLKPCRSISQVAL
jgi:hypothetical protein